MEKENIGNIGNIGKLCDQCAGRSTCKAAYKNAQIERCVGFIKNVGKLCDRCKLRNSCVASESWGLDGCVSFVKAQDEEAMEKTMGNCLHEADKIINGERQDEYGCPEDSFEIIAGYWNVFLRKKINDACHGQGVKLDIPDLLTPLDTTNMMILFKQARKLGQKPKRDNYVDSAGYEAIGADRLMRETETMEC